MEKRSALSRLRERLVMLAGRLTKSMRFSETVISIPDSAKTALVLLGALVVLSIFYLGVVLNVPYEADAGTMMTMARAVLEGNPLLKGWTLGTISFWTTELPFYVAGILMFGFTWKVLYVVAAVHWAAIALLILYLSSTDERGRVSLSKLFIAFSLTLYLASLAFRRQYLSTGHLVTFSYCLICLHCIRRLERTGQWTYYLGFGTFLALSLIGDSFGMFIIAIPVGLVCLARMVLSGDRRPEAGLLITILCAIAFSRGVLALLEFLGGAIWVGPRADFVSLPALGHSVYLLLSHALDLFAADFLGTPLISSESMLGLIHFSGLLLFVAATYRVATQLSKHTLYMQVVVAIVLCSVLAVLLSAAAGETRFLAPVLIFGILLVVPVVHDSGIFRDHRKLVLLYFLILLVSLAPPMSFGKPSTQYDDLAKLLVKLNLPRGYAPYSKSNPVTVATAGKVIVAPIYLRNDGAIAPFFWLADPTWFQDQANFVIVETDPPSTLEPSREDVVEFFGEPTSVYSLGASGDLLVWDHNIATSLALP